MYNSYLIVIMFNKDSLDFGMTHNWYLGICKLKRFIQSFRHVGKVKIISIFSCFREENFHEPNNRSRGEISALKNLHKLGLMRIVEEKMEEITGERSRKEPAGEVENWKNKDKVWRKLVKGGVANFFEKLHGFDPEVTNSMVNSWNNGRVKVNKVSFQITEEVVAEVTGIPMEGFKFHRDKKLSSNVVKDFMKNSAKMNKLVKKEYFFVMEMIKKLWRFVLYAIIEYVTLDPRSDRVMTHHFVILNHFRHKSKISFPFYLFTSMNKAISSFKKKATVNPSFHEGLFLLIHEHFKAQTLSNNPHRVADDDKGSSNFSSDSDDIESINSDAEIASSRKKIKGQDGKSPTAKTPSRKIPRDHGQTQKKRGLC